ncbi:MAG: DUF937 domain-containing protein [Candidatus Eisenbacteria bacterium]|nr:DUF937 domain-containing protein [Candidatus Eisenbacteria bacterium]
MSAVMQLLQQQLSGEAMNQISRRLNADPATTQNAISAALPLLVGALARNSSNPSGAESLHGALERDHDGSILDGLGAVLGNLDLGQGAAILGHVLGARQDRVQRGLGQTTGLNAGQIGTLLTMLAPIVLGALGKMQRQQNLDSGGLGSMLNRERQSIEQRAPREMGLLESLLDADGDGDVDLSDLARKGLGKLFGQ